VNQKSLSLDLISRPVYSYHLDTVAQEVLDYSALLFFGLYKLLAEVGIINFEWELSLFIFRCSFGNLIYLNLILCDLFLWVWKFWIWV